MTNLKFKSEFDTESKLDNTYLPTKPFGSSGLSLSRRTTRVFREFVVGIKLAYCHSDKKNNELETLVSHNLRLLHKRLLQITEYSNSFDDKNLLKDEHCELWQSLYKDQEMTCGFLTIQAQQDIPCYTHPGINSMYLLLSGAAKMNQFALQSIDGNRLNFDKLSSRDLNICDIVFFKSDNTKLTNLSTSDEACIFLNVQLSQQTNAAYH